MGTLSLLAAATVAADVAAHDSWLRIFDVVPWYAWLAVIAILGWSTESVLRSYFRYRERVEWLRQGYDPKTHKPLGAEVVEE